MRIKEGFVLRDIMGEYAVVYEGLEQISFNKIISLNSSAVAIWKGIDGQEFDVDSVAKILMDEYQIDRDLAYKDGQAFIDRLKEVGVI